jgi:hypothetical protein
MNEDFEQNTTGGLFLGAILLVYCLAWITRRLNRKAQKYPGSMFALMTGYALVLAMAFNSIKDPGSATIVLQRGFYQLAIYCFIAWIVRGISFNDGVRHANWLKETKVADQQPDVTISNNWQKQLDKNQR